MWSLILVSMPQIWVNWNWLKGYQGECPSIRMLSQDAGMMVLWLFYLYPENFHTWKDDLYIETGALKYCDFQCIYIVTMRNVVGWRLYWGNVSVDCPAQVVMVAVWVSLMVPSVWFHYGVWQEGIWLQPFGTLLGWHSVTPCLMWCVSLRYSTLAVVLANGH